MLTHRTHDTDAASPGVARRWSLLLQVAVAALVASASIAQSANADVFHFAGDCDSCRSIAVSSDGVVFTSGSDATKLVSQFDAATGAPGTAFSVGSLSYFPTSVAAMANGNVAVGMANGLAVVKTRSGTTAESLNNSPAQTSDLVEDSSGNLYFVSAGQGTLWKLSSDRNTRTGWDSGNGHPFMSLVGIGYNAARDHLYVADGELHKVFEVTTAGVVVSEFGGFGNGPNQLNSPGDVVADDLGNTYVSQPNLVGSGSTVSIKKFDSTGVGVGSMAQSRLGGQPWRLALRNEQLFATLFSRLIRVDLSAPVASASASASSPKTSQKVTLDGGASWMPFGAITRFEWDLDGNGSFETDTGSTSSATVRYATPGVRTIAARVTGTGGGTKTTTASVTVEKSAATVTASNATAGDDVAFDASGSVLADSEITDVSWDLDGDGTYERDTGTTLQTKRAFETAGTRSVGVRIVRSAGVTDTGQTSFTVTQRPPAPPLGGGGAIGVSANDGAQFTNSPNVKLSVTWPFGSFNAVISNDGGFKVQTVLPLAAELPWRLASSGPERLPKTVYVRFDANSQTFTDDIILDETPPLLTSAVISRNDAAASIRAATARTTYKVRFRASDRTSGVARVQLASSKSKPRRATKFKSSLAISGPKPKWARVQDRAGNYSRWRKLTAKRS